MMIRFFIFALVLMVGFSTVVSAQAAPLLSMDMAEDHVDITTGFTGEDIVVYGAKHSEGEIAVILEGPHEDIVVRRKASVLGAWINRSHVRFEGAPLYYDYALSVDVLTDLLPPNLLTQHHLGIDFLPFKARDNDLKDDETKRYREAFIRDRRRQEFFPAAAGKVEFIDDMFFKVRMHMPANVPQGEYTVRALLIRNGDVVAAEQKSLKVGQVGFNSNVYQFAQNQALLYALMCVCTALFFGWLSNKVARRG